MPKPKTSPDLTPKPYRLLKTDLAAKLSARSTGGITYLLLADTSDEPELHLAVTANEGGGLWSKEAVRLDTIETVLDGYARQPFPTTALSGAMVGRSSNNPPFCLAVLKDLGLVVPAGEKAHQHVKAGDWQAFRTEWLTQPGEPVIYPAPKVPDGQAEGTVIAATEPVTANKGKKRKKAVEMDSGTDADEPGAEACTPLAIPVIVEADHAPTALA